MQTQTYTHTSASSPHSAHTRDVLSIWMVFVSNVYTHIHTRTHVHMCALCGPPYAYTQKQHSHTHQIFFFQWLNALCKHHRYTSKSHNKIRTINNPRIHILRTWIPYEWINLLLIFYVRTWYRTFRVRIQQQRSFRCCCWRCDESRMTRHHDELSKSRARWATTYTQGGAHVCDQFAHHTLSHTANTYTLDNVAHINTKTTTLLMQLLQSRTCTASHTYTRTHTCKLALSHALDSELSGTTSLVLQLLSTTKARPFFRADDAKPISSVSRWSNRM